MVDVGTNIMAAMRSNGTVCLMDGIEKTGK
jgi:hypothetical protein